MSSVDEILASGRYKDRRGRQWENSDNPGLNEWFGGIPDDPLDRGWWCSPKEMRLLIERDQHRDECCGNRECEDHPVPHVYRAYRSALWHAHPGGARPFAETFTTHAEAMDAARALAVNP